VPPFRAEQIVGARFAFLVSLALKLCQRAVELDPNFAVIYGSMGAAYLFHRNLELSAASYMRAYQLRDRLTEKDGLDTVIDYYGRKSELAHQPLEPKYRDNLDKNQTRKSKAPRTSTAHGAPGGQMPKRELVRVSGRSSGQDRSLA
jgi:hypothetical protein